MSDNPKGNPLRRFLRWIIEFRGRRKSYARPDFTETKLIDDPCEFKIGFFGFYLPLFPNASAVVISNQGERRVSNGGYIKLPSGIYSVVYVDMRDRYEELPKVEEKTADGAFIAITISITYRVSNPLEVQNTVNPLEALHKICDAAVKKIIHRYQHDQIIGDENTPPVISDSTLANEISQEISNNRACKAFSQVNVGILNRAGNYEIMAERQKVVLQKHKNESERKDTIQKKQTAEEKNVLSKIIAEGDADIKDLWAKLKVRHEVLSLSEVTQLKNDLENRRKQPEYQQEIYLAQLDATKHELDTLIQALAQISLTNNAAGQRIAETISSHMVGKVSENHPTQSAPEPAPESEPGPKPQPAEPESDQDSMFVHLMIPKKKK